MKQLTKEAVLCVLWAVFVVSLFVISLPIYAIWAVFNNKHLYSWTAKFCGFLRKAIIQKQWTKKK